MISIKQAAAFGPLRAGILLFAAAAAASAAVIDFEDLTVPFGDYTSANPTISRGFSLSATFGGYEWDADGASRGSKSFFTDSSPITLTKVGGGAFDLISFWAAEDNTDSSRTITITGFFSGGGNVATTFVVDGFFNGLGGADDYQLFTLPGTFVGLSSVVFTDPLGDLSLDDITVGPLAASGVPEPSSIVLAASAIAAALFHRMRSRRRRGILR